MSRARTVPAKRSTQSRRNERILLTVVLSLVCLGLVMVYSATSTQAIIKGTDTNGQIVRQAVYAMLGIGALFFVARMNTATFTRIAPLALMGSAALLVAILVLRSTPTGEAIAPRINGATRWLVFGGVQLQPSELAKLSLVLWIAAMVARDPKRITRPGGLTPYLIVAGVLAVLIVAEPDLGTAGIIVMTAFIMAFIAGAPVRTLGIVAGTVAFLVVCRVATSDYQRSRVVAFLNPWADPVGEAYQNVQAQIAIGSGGFFGRGLGNGIQPANFLPEAHTDMIGAVIGEELGLIGLFGVILAFITIAVVGFRIGLRSNDAHGRLLACGATTLICLQGVINLAQVFGALPITGVPLPFVSAGGSSLVVFLATVGLIVNISRRGNAAAARKPRAVPGSDRGRRDGGARQTRPRDRRRLAS